MKRLIARYIAFVNGFKLWEKLVIVICLFIIGTQLVELAKPPEPPYIPSGFTWTDFSNRNDPLWLAGRDFKLTIFRYAILLESKGITETYELPMMEGYYLYKQTTPFTVTIWSDMNSIQAQVPALQVTNDPAGCDDQQVTKTEFRCSPSYLKITLPDGNLMYVENNQGDPHAVIDDMTP